MCYSKCVAQETDKVVAERAQVCMSLKTEHKCSPCALCKQEMVFVVFIVSPPGYRAVKPFDNLQFKKDEEELEKAVEDNGEAQVEKQTDQ